MVWSTVVYLGLVMTALGYGIWYSLVGRHPVSRVAPFLLLLPVFSVIGGVTVLGESLTLQTSLGGAVVIAGVGFILLERGTDKAPQAIGTYSQAVQTGNTVYLSGQIPLVPETMEMVEGNMETQIRRVFDNLSAVAEAAGGSLENIAKLNIFLTDLGRFPLVNQVMAEYFQEPYPARAAVGVASLPKDAAVEMDAVLVLND